MRLLAIGPSGMRTHARHGHFGTMEARIDLGISGCCGFLVGSAELPSLADTGFPPDR
ncbi:hypothetical protein [Thauera sp. Sel9]|uniref:hypothetical protein n=1 Tax=Thauera sp. Sel9 TaxID=2974299 RepID=UPI0021E197B6|nr:hypothetical protein [Thauera sp. Sel9]MCV2218175.1 hypothetical protein [Thauera sp. Sel9]